MTTLPLIPAAVGSLTLEAAEADTVNDRPLASPQRIYRKVKGGNITVKPGGGSWAGMWAEWDWDNWIRPQIDRAYLLGMNTVRVIGSPGCVLVDPVAGTLPKISQDDLLERWTQLAVYCRNNGMLLYPCLVQKSDFIDVQGGGGPWNFQAADVTDAVVAIAQTLAAFPKTVIGFDLFQEGDPAGSVSLADVLAIYAAVRAVAPQIPLTTSNSSGGFGSAAGFWNDSTSLSYQVQTNAAGSDFVDLHVYLDSLLPTDPDGYIQRVGKPVIFGEFGDSQDQSQGNITARYTAMAALHNRPGVIGSLAWALADQSTTTSNKWGVWDNTGFTQPVFPSPVGSTPLSTTSGKRTYITDVLRASFNIADAPTTPYAQPNLLTALQARPVNTTTGWVVGANTFLFTDGRGLGFSATAAGTTQVSTTKQPVASATYHYAAVSLLAGVTARACSMQIDWYDVSNVFITSSTAVTGTDDLHAPLTLSTVARSPGNAVYAVVTIKVTDPEAMNEAHLILAYPGPILRPF